MAVSKVTIVSDPKHCELPVWNGSKHSPCGQPAALEVSDDAVRYLCREHHYLELLKKKDQLKKLHFQVLVFERAKELQYCSAREARKAMTRRARIANGLCAKCGGEPKPGRRLCEKCTKRQLEANERYKIKSILKELG